jgi:hypothetical protein
LMTSLIFILVFMKPKKTHEFVLHGLCPFEGHQAQSQ